MQHLRSEASEGYEYLTRALVERFLERQLQHESPTTVRRRLATLKHFFGQIEDHMVPGVNVLRFVNPCRDLRGPEVEPPRPQWLSREEVRRLILFVETCCHGFTATRNKLALYLMYYAGLRSEEVRSLTYSNLSLDLKELRQFRRKGNKWATLPLNEAVTTCLEEYLPLWEEAIMEHAPNWRSTPAVTRATYPLIVSTAKAIPGVATTYRLSAKQLWVITNETGNKCGIAGLRPHKLRHTCAHEMISRGVPIQVVQKFLGHSDINTTTRYTVPDEEELRNASGRL